MADNVILQKVSSIERCLARIEEEYTSVGGDFEGKYTQLDAAALNLQRACEQSIDLANHVIKQSKLGLPTSSRESFEVLAHHGFIPSSLALQLKKMVGFRNIAVHEYQSLKTPIIESIIKDHLQDFRDYCAIMIKMN